VILDRTLSLDLESDTFSSDCGSSVLVFTSQDNLDSEKARDLLAKGHALEAVPETSSGLDLKAALKSLAEQGIFSVLCEGGGKLAGSLIEEKLVDRLELYQAPLEVGRSSRAEASETEATGIFLDGLDGPETGVWLDWFAEKILSKAGLSFLSSTRLGPDEYFVYQKETISVEDF